MNNENLSGFYMTIENVFSFTGKGLIVIGTVSGGSVKKGDNAEIYQNEAKLYNVKIIGIDVFRQSVDIANQGEKVGLILEGIDDKNMLENGMTITNLNVKEIPLFEDESIQKTDLNQSHVIQNDKIDELPIPEKKHRNKKDFLLFAFAYLFWSAEEKGNIDKFNSNQYPVELQIFFQSNFSDILELLGEADPSLFLLAASLKNDDDSRSTIIKKLMGISQIHGTLAVAITDHLFMRDKSIEALKIEDPAYASLAIAITDYNGGRIQAIENLSDLDPILELVAIAITDYNGRRIKALSKLAENK